MAPLKQNMVCGVSGSCVMKACFCCWHHTAGPPGSAQTLTLCGSGPSVFFNHPNVEAARLTALHRRVKPLPRTLINKHTTSQGVPQVVSVNPLNGASLSDGSKERPYVIAHPLFSSLSRSPPPFSPTLWSTISLWIPPPLIHLSGSPPALWSTPDRPRNSRPHPSLAIPCWDK